MIIFIKSLVLMQNDMVFVEVIYLNTDFIRHITHTPLNWSPVGTKLPAGVDENSPIGLGALK
jgi:hypothetical protein